jgi:hypothetical protein
MSRITRLARQIVISLVVATALLLALLALPQTANRAESPVWREDLDTYLAFKTNSGAGPVSILAISQAAQPWDFDYRLSPAAFDSYKSYAVSYGYTAPPVAEHAAMMHPPSEVYCVLLQKSAAPEGPATRESVLVAGYDSLYSTEWIIHEGPPAPFPAPYRAALAAIGCKLPE